MSAVNKITDLLNRQALTIPELAAELGISRNSTHLQVRKLEAAGVLEKLVLQMSSSAGRPAYQYRTAAGGEDVHSCLLYTSPSPRDATLSRMPSSA